MMNVKFAFINLYKISTLRLSNLRSAFIQRVILTYYTLNTLQNDLKILVNNSISKVTRLDSYPDMYSNLKKLLTTIKLKSY